MTKLTIRKRTVACAQNLTKLGCTTNDCIGIIARNSSNLTPLIFGALCIGAPVSPLDVILVKGALSLIILSQVLNNIKISYDYMIFDLPKSATSVSDVKFFLDSFIFLITRTLNTRHLNDERT